MSKEVVKRGEEESVVELKPNPRRGLERDLHARDFVRDYPIGERVSSEALDDWLATHGMLTKPPEGTRKNEDAWMAHLQRRHIAVGRLNKAATHPRMKENGSTPFFIEARGGAFFVNAPHSQIVRGEVPRKVQSLVRTKRRQLRYLMESADFAMLPPWEQSMAESIYNDIDMFEEQIVVMAKRLSQKCAQLDIKIKKAIATGQVKPMNGGIKHFLEPPADEEIGEE